MLFREQELRLQNAPSLHVVGPSVWTSSQPADLRLEPDTAVFKRKLKNTRFVVFLGLLRNFLRFNVTIVIRYWCDGCRRGQRTTDGSDAT